MLWTDNYERPEDAHAYPFETAVKEVRFALYEKLGIQKPTTQEQAVEYGIAYDIRNMVERTLSDIATHIDAVAELEGNAVDRDAVHRSFWKGGTRHEDMVEIAAEEIRAVLNQTCIDTEYAINRLKPDGFKQAEDAILARANATLDLAPLPDSGVALSEDQIVGLNDWIQAYTRGLLPQSKQSQFETLMISSPELQDCVEAESALAEGLHALKQAGVDPFKEAHDRELGSDLADGSAPLVYGGTAELEGVAKPTIKQKH